MIRININHNLEDLIDQINQLQNNVQSKLSEAYAATASTIGSDIESKYQTSDGNIEVNFDSDGTDYVLTVDNIETYDLQSTSGEDLQDVIEYAMSVLQENITNSFLRD